MPFRTHKFLQDIALADVAFEARGATFEELFQNAAQALLEVSVNPASLKKCNLSRTIRLTGQTPQDLLYDLLSELIFLKDADGFLAGQIKVKMVKQRAGYQLHAKLKGEIINPKQHQLRVDVKAATKHLFEIKQDKQGYKARVILDI